MVEYGDDGGGRAVVARCQGVGERGEEGGWVGDLDGVLMGFVGVDWMEWRLPTIRLVLSSAVMTVVVWSCSRVGRSEKTCSK